MKKKYVIGLIAIIVIIIAIVIIMFLTSQHYSMNNDFIFLGEYDNYVNIDDNYVLTSYEDFKEKFNSDKVTKKDFEKNNYVLIEIYYNPCSELDIKPTDYTIDGNEINITVKYKSQCGGCKPGYMYYLLKVDKKINNVSVNIESKAVNDPRCDPNAFYKPIIYLYPKSTMDVSVKLENEKNLTTTYPKYDASWEVTANPDGILIDKKTGRELYGLYWEGEISTANIIKDGFVVKGEDTIIFLEEKLAILGLTEREANEFIIYWLPKLEKNKYNYIRFETTEAMNKYMPLNITPSPDTLIRVLMVYKPLDTEISVEEQKLTTPERYGFTVVEWGGSLIN